MKYSCPVCGEKSKISFETEYCEVVACQNNDCTHYFAVNVNDGMGICYKDEAANKYEKYKERNKNLIRYFESKSFLRPSSVIIDIGSGDGHLLRSILEESNVLSIDAIEPSESYWSDLDALGISPYRYIDEITEVKDYNTALCIEVIEHVDKPVELLAQIKNKLKDGGTLFITTPNGVLGDEPNFSYLPAAYRNPTHVHFFTKKSLELAIKKAGFKNIKYKYIPELYPSNNLSSIAALKMKFRNSINYRKNRNVHLTLFVK